MIFLIGHGLTVMFCESCGISEDVSVFHGVIHSVAFAGRSLVVPSGCVYADEAVLSLIGVAFRIVVVSLTAVRYFGLMPKFLAPVAAA